MNRLWIVLLLAVTACMTTREAFGPSESLDLVRLTKLPVLPSVPLAGGLKIIALFGVRIDGTVEKVELIRGSNDQAWDDAAVDSLSQWRFVPAAKDDERKLRWVQDTVVIRMDSPVTMHLLRLYASTTREADSLHGLLRRGQDFEELARRSTWEWPDGGSWFCASADVCVIPPRIREAVRTLEESEFTPPIRLGGGYVIYKRIGDKDVQRILPPS